MLRKKGEVQVERQIREKQKGQKLEYERERERERDEFLKCIFAYLLIVQ